MPPPDPRSRTVSPGARVASAVGFPHPSEARTASVGSPDVSASAYRLEVIGSSQPADEDPPQQELPRPAAALSAASPYFSRTICTMSCDSPAMCPPTIDQQSLMNERKKRDYPQHFAFRSGVMGFADAPRISSSSPRASRSSA